MVVSNAGDVQIEIVTEENLFSAMFCEVLPVYHFADWKMADLGFSV